MSLQDYILKWQYYYKRNECTASTAHCPECICWHDEGTGPFPEECYDEHSSKFTWRSKR